MTWEALASAHSAKSFATSSARTASRWPRSGRLLSPLIAGACAWASVGAHAAGSPTTPPVIAKTYEASREGTPPSPIIAVGAPNIIWIMLDDVGFAASSAFGGLVPTPTLDSLAAGGLRYTNFHTTGICSPTRAALLTGRNHHEVGMGMFPLPFMSAEFPGYTGRIEQKDGTVADYLHKAGYSTYAIGKWHLTPDGEQTPVGPFDRWPTHMGFDHFFGFLGGATDQYKPHLVEDTLDVKADGRQLNAQLFDKAITYIDHQEQFDPAKPFFMYIAPGATHAPIQVDRSWIDKYKHKFDDGWDVFRQRILTRQKKMGIIPANAQLPTSDPRIPPWSSLNADEKKVFARFMEAYAGFLDYTDSEIGRLIDHLRQTKLIDNTVIFVIVGDNGASKEGGRNGTLIGEMQSLIGDNKGQIKYLLAHYDEIGTGTAYSNYPTGWAQAADTPFRKLKSDADAEGGTRNGMIVYWQNKLAKGEFRTQYGHVIDMLPTALELAKATMPQSINGVRQDPLEGISLAYSFKDPAAPSRHLEQYYFLFGNGAMVKDGWKASFSYHPDFWDLYRSWPIPTKIADNAGKEVWELYNLNTDFNERNNLAARYPAQLKELKALFDLRAKENNVYPLINWTDVYFKTKAFFHSPKGAAWVKSNAP